MSWQAISSRCAVRPRLETRTRRPPRTRPSTAASCVSRAMPRWSASGGRWSRSCAPTSPSPRRAATAVPSPSATHRWWRPCARAMSTTSRPRSDTTSTRLPDPSLASGSTRRRANRRPRPDPPGTRQLSMRHPWCLGRRPWIDDLRLSEEFSAGAARLRIDVHGGEPREHVLDDLNFLNYRLADVRISPQVTLADPDIVWRQEGEKDVTLRRAGGDLHGCLAGGAAAEGHRGRAGAAHGGGRAASLAQCGRPLPRQDDPVPGRRVQSRQVHGAHRGRPAGCPAGRLGDDRHRRGRASRDGIRGHLPAQAHGGHRALGQGRPQQGRREVLGRDADVGHVRRPARHRPRRRARHRRQLRPGQQPAHRLRSPVPVPALAAELLPHQRAAGPGPRHAHAGRRRPSPPPRRASSRASASDPSSSSGQPPRRCSWTKWRRSSSGSGLRQDARLRLPAPGHPR